MRIIGFLSTIDVILGSISYLYLRQNFVWARSWHFILLFLVLAINMPLSAILPDNTPVLLSKISAWLEGLWIALLYYTSLLAILHLVVYLIGRLIGMHLPHHFIATAALTFIIGFVGWGTWHAFHPVVRTERITTDKLAAGEQYKIVLLTDIHLGRTLGRNYAAKMVAKVNGLQPDVIVIAGDTIDERIAYVTAENSLAELKHFHSKKGTYLAFGNHEYIDNPALWREMVEAQGITVLIDADTVIDNKIKITGLTDYSRHRATDRLVQLAQNNAAYYNILLDHQPRRMDAAAEAGYDLYLAGHTHTGQLFPNKLVTERMYKLDYGRKNFGAMTAITSAGHGFWGPPVRTENAPEIVVIELSGEK